MSRLRGVLHRLRTLLAPNAYARDTEREMQFHLDLEAMQQQAVGTSADEAPWAARRRFGNATHVREEVRRMTAARWVDRISQDLRYAVRGLRRSPAFTVMVALTLGLGLGTNAAMFAFLDRIFLETPTGVTAPDQLRRLYVDNSRPREPGGRAAYPTFNYPEIRAMRAATDSAIVIGLFETRPDSVMLQANGQAIPARQGMASASYFSVLGVHPAAGRFFDTDEDAVERPSPVVIISYDLWQRAFRGAATVLGTPVTIDDRPFTVIGVTARGFAGIDLQRNDIWIPINMSTGSPGRARVPWFESYSNAFGLIARMPSTAAEQRFLDVATSAERDVHIAGWGYDSTVLVRDGPLLAALGPSRGAKEIGMAVRLAGVTLIVLLITCANVSNLLLVRSTRRAREIAMRRALGVSRGRLVGQLLTESVLLALIGGGAAVLFGFWGATVLRKLLLPSVHWATGVADTRIMVFAAAMAALVGVAAGLAPALHAGHGDLSAALRAGQREGAYRRSRLRTVLLTTQVALSVVLTVGAGLLVRSLHNVREINLGYDRESVLIATPMFSASNDHSPTLATFLPLIGARLASMPGVAGAAWAGHSPMGGETFIGYKLADQAEAPSLNGSSAAMDWVSPDYFRVVGIPVLAGRVFSSTDGPSGFGVVVNESMARTTWPGENAVGKCIAIGRAGCAPVIGVVGDVHRSEIIEPPFMRFYLPNPGAPRTLLLRLAPHQSSTEIREAASAALRGIPGVSTARVQTLDEFLEPEFRPWRLGASLFAAVGVLALLVAVIGVYSVVSYAMSQRTLEIGIRVALGGTASDILRLVVGEGAQPLLAGVLGGLIMALAFGHLIESQLFGLTPRDPLVLLSTAAMLTVAGVAACLIPAWRASRVSPVTALRSD